MDIHKLPTALRFLFAFALLAAVAPAMAQEGPIKVQLKNEEAVNSDGLDFSPTFYEDGIVFISTNTAGLKKTRDERLKLSAMSILRSRRNAEGQLNAPEPFARELSSQFHEGPVCFDRTAETIYFSRNATEGGKVKLSKDGTQKMRLYAAKKSGEAWGEPQLLPFNNADFDDCHPAISIDGDKMIFASNRPGGKGGMDLYIAYRLGESWSEPVNLGDKINTDGNEVFPFLHADNTLYFASNKQVDGKGGFDLYSATLMENAEWSAPKNIGTPFNTSGDDFGLIVDLNKINGYFSSNGQGGKGGDEILSFHVENGNLDSYLLQHGDLPVRKLDLRLIVSDKLNGTPIESADINIYNSERDNAIGLDDEGNLITYQNVEGQDQISSVPADKGLYGYTNERGRYATEVNSGNYTIIISKDQYQTKQLRVPITKPGNELRVQLEKNSVNGKVRWNGSVYNYVTNTPLAGATLVLTNQATGKRDTAVADANGLIDYYLDPNSKYKVDMYQGGRLVGSTELETGANDGKPIATNLSVAPLMPGSVIELPNIYYNFNDATLRPDARKDLNMVAALMKQHKGLVIELASHTDCRGSSYYNQDLSQRRANGVAQYLQSQGIAAARLHPVGYGESEPRNNCTDGVACTEQQHARNRRTEVRVTTGLQGASMVYVDGQLNNSQESDPTPQSGRPGTSGGSKPNVATAGNGQQFYVIAGSFLMENRADNQLAMLKSSGYPEAQIVRFQRSTFFSVCAGIYGSRKEAEMVERKLEAANIDAFVRAVQ